MKRTFKVGQTVTIRTLTDTDADHYPELQVGDKGLVAKVFPFHIAMEIEGKWYGMEKFQLDIEGESE